MKKMYILLAAGLVLSAVSGIMLLASQAKYREVHIHTDFKVYLGN